MNDLKYPFQASDIGLPSKEKVGPGRLNSSGMPYLYLGDNLNTVLLEIKASSQDKVIYTQFETVTELMVVDFRKIKQLSPFWFEDKTAYMLNRQTLLDINTALKSQPYRN